MPIQDRNMNWLRQSRVIQVQEFSHNTAPAGTTAGFLASGGVGAVDYAEVVDGLDGAVISTANDDLSVWDFNTLRVADPRYEIGLRVWYTFSASGATTDSVTWKIMYDRSAPGDTIIKPATTLDTIILAQPCKATTPLQLMCSSRGIIAADKFSWSNRGDLIAWLVEAEAITTYGATELHFLGLEIDYIPKLLISESEVQDVFKDQAAVDASA